MTIWPLDWNKRVQCCTGSFPHTPTPNFRTTPSPGFRGKEGERGRGEEKGRDPQALVDTLPCSKSWKIPWCCMMSCWNVQRSALVAYSKPRRASPDGASVQCPSFWTLAQFIPQFHPMIPQLLLLYWTFHDDSCVVSQVVVCSANLVPPWATQHIRQTRRLPDQ